MWGRERSRSRSKSPNKASGKNSERNDKVKTQQSTSTPIPDDNIKIDSKNGQYQSGPISKFEEVDFPKPFFTEFKTLGYKAPTPIQGVAIPIALEGLDIIGVAKTGSGKTLSFILPILMGIQDEKNYCKEKNKKYDTEYRPRAVVLTPTRELACQIFECAKPFAKSIGIDCVCVYGGADGRRMKEELYKGCDLVIATPGRLNDFIDRKNIILDDVFMFILDEADRMLDMGFLPQVRNISNALRTERQTLMWSATWPKEVEELSRNLCKNDPVTIRVGNEALTVNSAITQNVFAVDEDGKKKELLQVMKKCFKSANDKVLIFMTTKRGCDTLAATLSHEGYEALAIHGDKDQDQRERILEKFRGKANILVATDVASRGLDIKNIKAVINYDFPTCIEDYVHRIGRTGRAGATGDSYTFFTRRDSSHAQDLIDVSLQ